MRLKLVPEETAIDFLGMRTIAAAMSGAAIIASIAIFFMMGLNFGIDFRGGVTIEARTEGPADLGQIRSITGGLDLGDVSVQEFGQPEDVLIQVEVQQGDGDVQQAVVSTVKDALTAEIQSIEFRRVEVVGPKVSGELIEAGVIAIVLAVVAVLIYIWLRFEWQFSVGAVAALVHDVVLTIGIFSLVQLEFNLSIIAALLTIVGYSLNDTVVVFDRVRENLRRFKTKALDDVLNLSINETLSRTVMTSVTTLIALLSLYFLGGEVIRGFTFGMIWGVLVGTYSSVFVASVILRVLGVKRDWSKPDPNDAGVQFGSPDAP
ncbi:MAG: protein translocase subunit SecF [Pseudomonadota bacterium]